MEKTANAASTEGRTIDSSLAMNASLFRAEMLRHLIDPSKDIDAQAGYPEHISPADYWKMYRREGVGARIVDIFPEESWKGDPIVYETEDEKQVTEWEKQFKILLKKHHLWHYLERVDKLSGVGRFGILLIGIDDGLDLKDPIEPKEGRQLLYLKPFAENSVTISKFDSDETSPRFGLPEQYTIRVLDYSSLGGDAEAPQESKQKTLVVHWSRVLHVADNRLSSEVYGVPRMQDVFNRLCDVRKVAGGSGEMFWRGGFPGYATEVDPETELDVDSARKEIDSYFSGLQRMMLLSGVRVKSLNPQVADPTNHIVTAIKLIAMSKGIPYRIFLGTEEARLAGSEDSKAWNMRIMRRNRKYVAPLIIRPFLDRLMEMGVLPSLPEGTTFTIEYEQDDQLTEKEKAEIREKEVNTIARYVQSGASTLIPEMEFLTLIMGKTQEEATAILEAASKRIDGTDLELEDE